MGVRRKAREMALAAVFEHEFSGLALPVITKRVLAEELPSDDVTVFYHDLVKAVAAHQDEIDALIVKFSNNWKLVRMAGVDRNVLRLGVAEILFLPEIPKSVTINEYLEVAKKFGSEDSSSFVNGILDKLDKPNA
jgi:N utilization substance protein B